jgi:hypothetical protein
MARTPRGEVVDSDEVGCVHIVQRCVGKSFLCGVDQATGKNYEHRKTLIQERLQFLARYFAVDVLAFAVLSNHTHGVLRNWPDLVKGSQIPGPPMLSWRGRARLDSGKMRDS